jgi:hypothetical protein
VRAAAHFQKAIPSVKIQAPLPGETVVLHNGKCIETSAFTPYLSTVAKDQWPAHSAHAEHPHNENKQFFPPGSKQTEITDAQMKELMVQLQHFARFLYNSSLFHLLYKIGPKDCPSKRPTIAFLLRTDSKPTYSVWAYDPQACAFVQDLHAAQAPDPTDGYLAGVECWATDLLALFRFERTAGYTLFGRMRFWNTLAKQWNVELDTALYLYTHPLCQPDRYYTVYARSAQTVSQVQPLVRSAKE